MSTSTGRGGHAAARARRPHGHGVQDGRGPSGRAAGSARDRTRLHAAAFRAAAADGPARLRMRHSASLLGAAGARRGAEPRLRRRDRDPARAGDELRRIGAQIAVEARPDAAGVTIDPPRWRSARWSAASWSPAWSSPRRPGSARSGRRSSGCGGATTTSCAGRSGSLHAPETAVTRSRSRTVRISSITGTTTSTAGGRARTGRTEAALAERGQVEEVWRRVVQAEPALLRGRRAPERRLRARGRGSRRRPAGPASRRRHGGAAVGAPRPGPRCRHERAGARPRGRGRRERRRGVHRREPAERGDVLARGRLGLRQPGGARASPGADLRARGGRPRAARAGDGARGGDHRRGPGGRRRIPGGGHGAGPRRSRPVDRRPPPGLEGGVPAPPTPRPRRGSSASTRRKAVDGPRRPH